MTRAHHVDHCPTTCVGLLEFLAEAGLSGCTHVPEDGEALEFQARGTTSEVELGPGSGPRPGFQKWLVNQIAKVM